MYVYGTPFLSSISLNGSTNTESARLYVGYNINPLLLPSLFILLIKLINVSVKNEYVLPDPNPPTYALILAFFLFVKKSHLYVLLVV